MIIRLLCKYLLYQVRRLWLIDLEATPALSADEWQERERYGVQTV